MSGKQEKEGWRVTRMRKEQEEDDWRGDKDEEVAGERREGGGQR